jgi:hypothetical protein
MTCTAEATEFKDDGQEIYFEQTDCLLVYHWSTKYGAAAKVEWIAADGTAALYAPQVETVAAHTKGNLVWAVPNWITEAYDQARLIRQLANAQTAETYEETRQRLAQAKYPPKILDSILKP